MIFFYIKNFDKCFVKFITEIYSSMRNVTEQSKELKWGGRVAPPHPALGMVGTLDNHQRS